MDEIATADFLGMRRKYADVIAQNTDFQAALKLLQDKIDELEGQKEEITKAERGARKREDEKGPSERARWHFFAMIAEPWSKATKVSSYKLRTCMEHAIPERRRQVLPLIRATTPQPYLNFREFSLILSEFGISKKEWRKLIRALREVNSKELETQERVTHAILGADQENKGEITSATLD